MMQSKHAIERHRFFPYVAWFLVIGFSLFVYAVIKDLRAVSAELQETSMRLEMQAKTAPEDIEDFRR